MKAIILAGGFATRLGELGDKIAKPLIEICGKPAIQWIIEKLVKLDLDEIILTVNLKFKAQFEEWINKQQIPKIKMIIEPSLKDDDKPGAVQALFNIMHDSEDNLIIAGDNIFSSDLNGMVEFYREIKKPIVAIVELGNLELIKQYSTVEVDDDGKILKFIEKPERPRSSLVGACIYILPGWCKPLIKEYLSIGGDPDSPGRFIAWLTSKTEVYGFKLGGKWIDIGNPVSLKLAERMFRNH